jgi:hypothetical protein
MKSRRIPRWAIVLVASLFITSCGASSSSADKPTATTISLNDFKKDLSNKVEAVYTAIRQADTKTSKTGDGIPDSDVITSALLNESLYSKVEQSADYVGLNMSRSLCKGFTYDTLLGRLKPAEKVFSISFRQKNAQTTDSEDYVYVPVQLSVFPDVMVNELESLYQNFNDVVSAEGLSCETQLRTGTEGCKSLGLPEVANWYQESDMKKAGCSIGSNAKVAVTSTVEQIDYAWFTRPFVVNQISARNKGVRFARTVVVLPQRTLGTVFVLEVSAMRNGKNPSASDVPSLIKVGNISKRIAAEIVDKWAELVKEEFDLISLIAKDDAISNFSKG